MLKRMMVQMVQTVNQTKYSEFMFLHTDKLHVLTTLVVKSRRKEKKEYRWKSTDELIESDEGSALDIPCKIQAQVP